MLELPDELLADDEEQLTEGIRNSGAPAVNSALGRVIPRLERRARVRVRAALPIKVEFGAAETSIGETLDFSSKGIFFAFPHRVAIGARVDVTFKLPQETRPSGDVWLRCEGMVMRLVYGLRFGDYGIAVATNNYYVLPT